MATHISVSLEGPSPSIVGLDDTKPVCTPKHEFLDTSKSNHEKLFIGDLLISEEITCASIAKQIKDPPAGSLPSAYKQFLNLFASIPFINLSSEVFKTFYFKRNGDTFTLSVQGDESTEQMTRFWSLSLNQLLDLTLLERQSEELTEDDQTRLDTLQYLRGSQPNLIAVRRFIRSHSASIFSQGDIRILPVPSALLFLPEIRPGFIPSSRFWSLMIPIPCSTPNSVSCTEHIYSFNNQVVVENVCEQLSTTLQVFKDRVDPILKEIYEPAIDESDSPNPAFTQYIDVSSATCNACFRGLRDDTPIVEQLKHRASHQKWSEYRIFLLLLIRIIEKPRFSTLACSSGTGKTQLLCTLSLAIYRLKTQFPDDSGLTIIPNALFIPRLANKKGSQSIYQPFFGAGKLIDSYITSFDDLAPPKTSVRYLFKIGIQALPLMYLLTRMADNVHSVRDWADSCAHMELRLEDICSSLEDASQSLYRTLLRIDPDVEMQWNGYECDVSKGSDNHIYPILESVFITFSNQNSLPGSLPHLFLDEVLGTEDINPNHRNQRRTALASLRSGALSLQSSVVLSSTHMCLFNSFDATPEGSLLASRCQNPAEYGTELEPRTFLYYRMDPVVAPQCSTVYRYRGIWSHVSCVHEAVKKWVEEKRLDKTPKPAHKHAIALAAVAAHVGSPFHWKSGDNPSQSPYVVTTASGFDVADLALARTPSVLCVYGKPEATAQPKPEPRMLSPVAMLFRYQSGGKHSLVLHAQGTTSSVCQFQDVFALSLPPLDKDPLAHHVSLVQPHHCTTFHELMEDAFRGTGRIHRCCFNADETRTHFAKTESFCIGSIIAASNTVQYNVLQKSDTGHSFLSIASWNNRDLRSSSTDQFWNRSACFAGKTLGSDKLFVHPILDFIHNLCVHMKISPVLNEHMSQVLFAHGVPISLLFPKLVIGSPAKNRYSFILEVMNDYYHDKTQEGEQKPKSSTHHTYQQIMEVMKAGGLRLKAYPSYESVLYGFMALTRGSRGSDYGIFDDGSFLAFDPASNSYYVIVVNVKDIAGQATRKASSPPAVSYVLQLKKLGIKILQLSFIKRSAQSVSMVFVDDIPTIIIAAAY